MKRREETQIVNELRKLFFSYLRRTHQSPHVNAKQLSGVQTDGTILSYCANIVDDPTTSIFWLINFFLLNDCGAIQLENWDFLRIIRLRTRTGSRGWTQFAAERRIPATRRMETRATFVQVQQIYYFIYFFVAQLTSVLSTPFQAVDRFHRISQVAWPMSQNSRAPTNRVAILWYGYSPCDHNFQYSSLR